MSSFLRTGMLWHLKMSKLFCWQHGQSLTSLLTTLWHLMSKQLSKGMSKMSKISLKWFDGMSILAFQVLTSQGIPTLLLDQPLYAGCKVQNIAHLLMFKYEVLFKTLRHARCKVQDFAHLDICKYQVLIKTLYLHHPYIKGQSASLAHLHTCKYYVLIKS